MQGEDACCARIGVRWSITINVGWVGGNARAGNDCELGNRIEKEGVKRHMLYYAQDIAS